MSPKRPLLVVGQAPGRRPCGGVLLGRSGSLLAACAGLPLHEWAARVERVNLLPRWPGANGKGDHFPLDEAQTAAGRLGTRMRARRVVLLGRGVARAFGANDLHPHFEWWRDDERDCWLALCPHPSGVNLWWNDQSNRERAAAFWRSACA